MINQVTEKIAHFENVVHEARKISTDTLHSEQDDIRALRNQLESYLTALNRCDYALDEVIAERNRPRNQ